MRKEAWIGVAVLASIVTLLFILMPAPSQMTDAHVGLLMLGLIVVTILLGFPTAFTLMGMGVGFSLYAYRNMGLQVAWEQTLDLMVLRTYEVMTNDVLCAVPLCSVMGYLSARASLGDRLFRILHLVMARVPGSRAVATVVTCAVFATATGIVGAFVTLMGLLALPVMLNAKYKLRLAAGSITAGGGLGIMLPPSIMLIVYGAVAGVSVVKLYAGAVFPGMLLAGLYIAYILIITKLRPHLAPPLPDDERVMPLSALSAQIEQTFGQKAVPALYKAARTRQDRHVAKYASRELALTVVPALVLVLFLGYSYLSVTKPDPVEDPALAMLSLDAADDFSFDFDTGLEEPLTSFDNDIGLISDEPDPATDAASADAAPDDVSENPRKPAPTAFWIFAGVIGALLAIFYAFFTIQKLEVFKQMITSFFPLAILVAAVLGSIVFGFATPAEAAAMGAFRSEER